MTKSCQWVESRLESYVSESLSPAERGELDRHAADCAACRSELAAFAEVDALVAEHFRRRLSRASRSVRPVVRPLRPVGVAAASLAAVWIGYAALAPDAVDPDTADKDTAVPDVERAKPDPDPEPAIALSEAPLQPPPAPVARFRVQDSAGYFHSLEDFSGSVLVLGVVDGNAATAAAFEASYARYAGESGLRFLAVPADGVDLDAPRFPTMANRASTLLETDPGEFTIISPDGAVHARGTLDNGDLPAAIDASLRLWRDRVPVTR